MSQDNDETIDSINDTETTENTETVEETESDDSVETLREALTRKDEANKKLFERAKKAEAEAKAARAKPDTINNPSELSEELKLIARGLTDEEIEQAKVVSKGKDISLNEAVKDPLFVSYQDKVKEEARKEKAKLGASRGSTQVEDKGFKPGMTREEHKELFDKTMGAN